MIQNIFIEMFLVIPGVAKIFTSEAELLAVAIIACIMGTILAYAIAPLLRSPRNDLIKFLHCPNNKWNDLKEYIDDSQHKRFVITLGVYCALLMLHCFFNMVFEQAVGHSSYQNFGQIMAMTVGLDLLVLGFSPSLIGVLSLVLSRIGASPFKNVAASLYKMRAYRSLRNI